MQGSRSLLLQLPSELQHLIWSKLNPHDLLSVARACRSLHDALRDTEDPAAVWGDLTIRMPRHLDGWHVLYWVRADLDIDAAGRANRLPAYERLFEWLRRRSRGIKSVSLVFDWGDMVGRDPSSEWAVLETMLPQLATDWRDSGAMPLRLAFDGMAPWQGQLFNDSARMAVFGGLTSLHIHTEDGITQAQFESICSLRALTALQIWVVDTRISGNGYYNGGLQEGLPGAVSRLTALESLMLRGHRRLASLPEELTALSRLSMLEVTECSLRRLPAWLGSLQCLRCILIRGNGHHRFTNELIIEPGALGGPALVSANLGLTYLAPKQVFQSATLQSLELVQRKTSFVLGDMPALTSLWVNMCDNDDDDDDIVAGELDWDGLCSLTSLQELQLGSECPSLPDNFSRLALLTVLRLACSGFAGLPPVLAALSQLRELKLNFRYMQPYLASSSFDAATLALVNPLPCLTQLSLGLPGPNWRWSQDEEFGGLRDSWREAVCQLRDAKPGCCVILSGCDIMADVKSASDDDSDWD